FVRSWNRSPSSSCSGTGSGSGLRCLSGSGAVPGETASRMPVTKSLAFIPIAFRFFAIVLPRILLAFVVENVDVRVKILFAWDGRGDRRGDRYGTSSGRPPS